MVDREKREGKWFQIGSYKNKHIMTGNKKNQVVSLETACFVSNLKRAQHITLRCAKREFYFSILKRGTFIEVSQSVMKDKISIHQTKETDLQRTVIEINI